MEEFEYGKEVVLAGACRTAIGKMGGSLSAQHQQQSLGSIVIKEAMNRAGVPADQVDHVYMGCVIQAGQDRTLLVRLQSRQDFQSKHLLLQLTLFVVQVLNCVNMAAQMIEAGDADIVVAGGMENMSMAPLL